VGNASEVCLCLFVLSKVAPCESDSALTLNLRGLGSFVVVGVLLVVVLRLPPCYLSVVTSREGVQLTYDSALLSPQLLSTVTATETRGVPAQRRTYRSRVRQRLCRVGFCGETLSSHACEPRTF
jgi:hypothetical protein